MIRSLLRVATLFLMPGLALGQHYVSERYGSEREHPNYVLGASMQRWTGSTLNWYYNPQNQPSNLSTSQVVEAIQEAAARWAGMCNIRINYMGLTSAAPSLSSDSSAVDFTNVFGWNYLSGDHANYAAVTKTWWSGNGLLDADIVINRSQSWTSDEVRSIMTHEIGHAIGLSHSDNSASVMFANPYHTISYMQVLRGDDANGCAALYGAATTADSNRVFNWAESAYYGTLLPVAVSAGTYSGYYYRYYPVSRSYVGTRDGRAYYMGPDGTIQDLGLLSVFFNSARAAGY